MGITLPLFQIAGKCPFRKRWLDVGIDGKAIVKEFLKTQQGRMWT
jgi:hypothetical protein